ncbi:MAG: hypothetical protein A2Z20_09805 [Bdellovibrionales bacterium RBG_16_40_8]|nr:MAG: hypothetical protein A2Z20_09805 [Bdellovibrionales bacterium RBG_16_40_8]
MRFHWSVLLILLTTSVIVVGCSNVGFDSIPKLSCSNIDISRDQNTTCFNSPNSVTVSFTFGVGDVDILFVNDNSGSMFVEQQKMAQAFPNFLSEISSLFYRIAITTTDVVATKGKFLEFVDEQNNSSGLTVIDRNTPNVSGLFRGTIQRNETRLCDLSGFNPNHCPSQDERGIYAANLAIKNGDKNFFRPGAHMALVILSDEDERSNGGKSGFPPLEAYDLPETLVLNLKNLYPTKSMSVHSVVTNDETCRQQQTQTSKTGIWPTLGYIGTQYMMLSNPSADLLALGNLQSGVVGSICASDYGAQLGNIAANISDNTLDAPKQLACAPDSKTINIVTSPVGYEKQIQYYIDYKDKIYFSKLPIGVKVTFSYDCPRY